MAIHLTNNKIIPPKEWEHNPEIKNRDGETVGYLLSKNNIEVP